MDRVGKENRTRHLRGSLGVLLRIDKTLERRDRSRCKGERHRTDPPSRPTRELGPSTRRRRDLKKRNQTHNGHPLNHARNGRKNPPGSGHRSAEQDTHGRHHRQKRHSGEKHPSSERDHESRRRQGNHPRSRSRKLPRATLRQHSRRSSKARRRSRKLES